MAICFMVATFEGVDLQAAGVAAPHLLPLMKLSPERAGEFFSASTVGILIGAPLGGWMADRIGRKTMLLLSIVVFGIFALSTAFAQDFVELVTLRLATGFGLGGALPNMIALASEHAPPERKGFAVGLIYAGMPLGGAFASLVAGEDWRTVFYIGGLAPLMLAPLVMVALRDSYRPPRGQASAQARSRPNLLFALFGAGRTANTLLLWVAFGFTLLVLYLLLNWLPTLLVSRGISRSAAASVQVAFNLGGAAGSPLAGRLVDGRHRGLVAGLTFAVSGGGLFLLSAAPGSLADLLAIGAVTGLGIIASQSVLYAMAPLCYPIEVRGAGLGAAVAVGRMGSLVGPVLAGQWVGAGHSTQDVLQHLLPIILVGALAAILLGIKQTIPPQVRV